MATIPAYPARRAGAPLEPFSLERRALVDMTSLRGA